MMRKAFTGLYPCLSMIWAYRWDFSMPSIVKWLKMAKHNYAISYPDPNFIHKHIRWESSSVNNSIVLKRLLSQRAHDMNTCVRKNPSTNQSQLSPKHPLKNSCVLPERAGIFDWFFLFCSNRKSDSIELVLPKSQSPWRRSNWLFIHFWICLHEYWQTGTVYAKP